MTPELERAYAEPHRRYHTRRHIEQCLALLDQVDELMDSERRVLTWAIWWHDAVYDPTASDNEAKSAELAKAALRDLDASIHEREEVARLIRLTAGHAVEPEDRLGEILVSIDLAILGAAPGAGPRACPTGGGGGIDRAAIRGASSTSSLVSRISRLVTSRATFRFARR